MTENRKQKFYFLVIIICLVISFFYSQEIVSSKELVVKKEKQETKNKKDKQNKEEKEEKKEPIKINEDEFEPVLIGALLTDPALFLEKQIKFRGRFSSFTTLALDYEKALRKSKDYISLCLFRTDSKIPLSELKLAYPVKEAKENQVIRDLEEGDLIEIYGKVFSAALDEPWVDIVQITKLESAQKKDDKKISSNKEAEKIDGNKSENLNKKKDKKLRKKLNDKELQE